MNLADRLGFGPKREVREDPSSGGYIVKVTPSQMVGKNLPAQEVKLTAEQLKGYGSWLNGELIQEALPDLSDEDRERLMTGLGPAEFNDVCGSDE